MNRDHQYILATLDERGYASTAATCLVLLGCGEELEIEHPIDFDPRLVEAVITAVPADVAARTLNRLGVYGRIRPEVFFRLFTATRRRLTEHSAAITALSSALLLHVSFMPEAAVRYAALTRRWARAEASWLRTVGVLVISRLPRPTCADVRAIFAAIEARSADVRLGGFEGVRNLLAQPRGAERWVTAELDNPSFQAALQRCGRSKDRAVRMAARNLMRLLGHDKR